MVRKILVRQRGYNRKAHIRRTSGHRVIVPKAHVKGSVYLKRDLGAPGHGKQIFKIKEGVLPEGYAHMPMTKRRNLLKRLIGGSSKKAKQVFGQLQSMTTLRAPVVKGTHRVRTRAQLKTYAKFKVDRDFVGDNYGKLLTPKEAIRANKK